MKEYQITTAETPSRLNIDIADAVSSGWQLLGPVTCSNTYNKHGGYDIDLFVATMWRELEL